MRRDASIHGGRHAPRCLNPRWEACAATPEGVQRVDALGVPRASLLLCLQLEGEVCLSPGRAERRQPTPEP
eukprot:336067-Chlamydomonas_euryale.AAC.2